MTTHVYTLTEIAKEAGWSHGALYRMIHYKTDDEKLAQPDMDIANRGAYSEKQRTKLLAQLAKRGKKPPGRPGKYESLEEKQRVYRELRRARNQQRRDT